MAKKFFIFFSFILIAGCQNNSGKPAIADPVHRNVKTKIPQKTLEAEIDPADNEIYTPSVVDVFPNYPGGIEKLYVFLKKNFVRSKEAIEKDIRDQPVFATIIIEKDGTISDIKILRDFGYGSGKEFLRVLKLSPKWIPAIKGGKRVRCSYMIPYYYTD